MAITIIFPNALRPYAGCNERVWVEAQTAGEALQQLFQRYPALRERLPDDLARLPHGAAIYRNGSDLRRLQGLDTPLRDGDRLTIIVPEGDL
ncbi:MoaD/ThiS family protein [Kallotenue papyrolyticum]|uniref:MoaD/ThiS family protein n=1 Tax=Kallotenue papyrolyticum TaxID=1325125 RepID=UPI0004785BF6|nr:MoaD/ThiS family protein [Kallotenue papyrolyticum]